MHGDMHGAKSKTPEIIVISGVSGVRGGGLEPDPACGEKHDLTANKPDREGGVVTDATGGHRSASPEDRSRTDPRSALLAALTRAIEDGASAGDSVLVRVAAGALAQLAEREEKTP